MTYLLIGAIALAACLLVACTHIYITPTNERDKPFGVNVQSSNSTNILGSQNVQKDDKAGRGPVTGNKGDSDQHAEATPTVVLPANVPIGKP